MLDSKHLQIFCFIVLFFSFHINTTLAQKIHIIDVTTKQGIAGVYVYNKLKTFAESSDSSGYIDLNFSLMDSLDIEKINAENIHFQHLSYQSETYTLRDLQEMNHQVLLLPKSEQLTEIVVAVGRVAEKLDEITNKVELIKAKDIQLNNPQTSAALLENTGSVYVQKSQMGGGSPVIRGFEANKVLLVVDGVRLNNAIYRGGHLQNVITIDNSVLDRTEVVFGPGSVIYGSDALGGVMHFFTKQPALSQERGKLKIKGSAFARYASANHEKTTHLDVSLGGQKFGSLTSVTFSDFDDLRIGTVRNNKYEDWGQRPFYVATFDAIDSLVTNDNPNILRFTGYHQIDALQKFYYKANEQLDFTLNLQYSTSSNIPRFDRLNDPKDNGLKFAEWHYGPQNRLFTSFTTSFNKSNKWFDGINLVAAFQKIKEIRIDRKFGANNRRHRTEDVMVYTTNLDFNKKINRQHNLQYGAEFTHNKVQSSAFREDIIVNEQLDEVVATRYPDGGSNMTTLAAYMRHKWHISSQLVMTTGARYSWINLAARFVDTTFFTLPTSEFSDYSQAFTGNLGLVYKPVYTTKLSLSLGTGFRSPNIDDATKVFDPNEEIVVVPNLNILPEYAYNVDFGIEQKFGNALSVRADAYFNYLTNLIKREPFVLNGQDSLLFDGDWKAIFANANAGKAYVGGFMLGAKWKISNNVVVEKKLNFTKGYDLTNDVPLGHIPPFFGLLTVGYTSPNKKLDALFSLKYNAWKRIGDYSPNSEDKAEEATADGTPAWYTLNVRLNYQFSSQFSINMALENILDHHYKPFASGISGAGRNFVVSGRMRF